MARNAPLLVLALSLAGGGAPVFAGEGAASEVDVVPAFEFAPHDDDVAVVIGVEKYRNAPASDFSASDAKLMREYLVAMGYPARNIELLTDDRATSGDMKRVLERWLPNKVKPESRVVVYYSGHGAPEPSTGKAYLVPWDGDPNYLEDTAYPVHRLEEALAKLAAKEVILIMDACFSGAGKEGKGRTLLAEGARPLVVTGPEAAPPSPKLAVLSAARRSQISASNPDYKHGLLTYHLLKAVREGKKSLSDIYAVLKSRVEDDAKSRNVEQTPSLSHPEVSPEAPPAFLLADITSVRAEAPTPKVDPKEAAAFERERKKLEEAQKRMEEEQAKNKAKQEAAEKRMREEKEEAERRMAEKERKMEAAAAERRAADERRRRRDEEALERRRRELERQGGQNEPVFVPPSF